MFNGSVATFFGLMVGGCAFEGHWMPEVSDGHSAFDLGRSLALGYMRTSTPATRFVSMWFLSHCLVDMVLAFAYYR